MQRARTFITFLAAATASLGSVGAQQDASPPLPLPAPPTVVPQTRDVIPPSTAPSRNDDATTESQTLTEKGIEPLARGPVHESFARPVDFKPEAPIAIKQKPPEPINELPPDAKPDGNAEWIPGYWQWDDDRTNFIWVSGTWRVMPGAQRWVEGYWSQNADGYIWTPGFWTATTEVAYLPEPPVSQEQGPVGEAPSDQHFWNPGSWVYQNTDYSWRPGYWAQGNADWMWTPDSYNWTPGGYVYSAGYWDYPYQRRGLLFSPVYFNQGYYNDPGFYYTPSYGVNLAGLAYHLFARPRWGHYYYGDYYGDSYANSGFFPWFSFNRWGGWDPYYSYYGFRYGRGDRNWDRRFHDRYDYYARNRDDRPPRDFDTLQRRRLDFGGDRRDEFETIVSLRDRDRFNSLTDRRVDRVSEDDRRQIARLSRDQVRDMRDRRREAEVQDRVTLKPSDEADQTRNRQTRPSRTLRLPDRGIAGRDIDRDGAIRDGQRTEDRARDNLDNVQNRDRIENRNPPDRTDGNRDRIRERDNVPRTNELPRSGNVVPPNRDLPRSGNVPPNTRDLPRDRDRDVPRTLPDTRTPNRPGNPGFTPELPRRGNIDDMRKSDGPRPIGPNNPNVTPGNPVRPAIPNRPATPGRIDRSPATPPSINPQQPPAVRPQPRANTQPPQAQPRSARPQQAPPRVNRQAVPATRPPARRDNPPSEARRATPPPAAVARPERRQDAPRNATPDRGNSKRQAERERNRD